MPILPKLNLRKYSSLSTYSDSPTLDNNNTKSKLSPSISEPKSSNGFTLLGYNRRQNGQEANPNRLTPKSASSKEEPAEYMPLRSPSPRLNFLNRGAQEPAPQKPHLTPYFQKRNSQKEILDSLEEAAADKEVQLKQTPRRPTLNPFFNANQRFMKALRSVGGKDNFNRLKNRRDE